ncbi:hypothetical protein [Yoonia sp. GPGPB17]|uniref:hypothetical protein n=1 Tax=Yoonia sp. GPGPB17 TaxID=3026147 RepID=UPI0030EC11B0
MIKAFGKALPNSFQGIGLPHLPNVFGIAEDHVLTGVLHRAVSTATQLSFKFIAPDQPFNISGFAPHNTTITGGL